MSQLPNGFAFVCPGVLDSTLMLAGTDKSNETRLNALIPWSISAEGKSWSIIVKASLLMTIIQTQCIGLTMRCSDTRVVSGLSAMSLI